MDHRVVARDGVGLSVAEWGGTGPALLFVHGFGHDGVVWEPFAETLAGSYRLLALDLRGHGASDRDPAFRYHHLTYEEDVADVVEALDLAPVTIVGHSAGGHAAIGFAARHPDRVARLVLVDAPAELRAEGGDGSPKGVPADWDGSFADLAEYERLLQVTYRRAAPELVVRLARAWSRPRADGRIVLTIDPLLLNPNEAHEQATGEAFDRVAWAREGSEGLWADLARVRCPTLVVRGGDSRVLPARVARRMAAEVLSDGRFVEVPGAGHSVMIDAPEGLGPVLVEFLLG